MRFACPIDLEVGAGIAGIDPLGPPSNALPSDHEEPRVRCDDGHEAERSPPFGEPFEQRRESGHDLLIRLQLWCQELDESPLAARWPSHVTSRIRHTRHRDRSGWVRGCLDLIKATLQTAYRHLVNAGKECGPLLHCLEVLARPNRDLECRR